MNRTFIALCVLLLLVPLPGAAGELMKEPGVAGAVALLDLWIGEQLEHRDLPGLSVGVVHDQDLVWARGFGYADLETETPATPATSRSESSSWRAVRRKASSDTSPVT